MKIHIQFISESNEDDAKLVSGLKDLYKSMDEDVDKYRAALNAIYSTEDPELIEKVKGDLLDRINACMTLRRRARYYLKTKGVEPDA